MTIDQLNKLTDEEVRIRVAERMGWTDVREQDWCSPLDDHIRQFWQGVNPETKDKEEIPPYLDDLNAAFTLVEKLRGERWTPEMFRPGLHWIVTFRRITMGEDMKIDENLSHSAADPSLARAICLAFLAVAEREEG